MTKGPIARGPRGIMRPFCSVFEQRRVRPFAWFNAFYRLIVFRREVALHLDLFPFYQTRGFIGLFRWRGMSLPGRRR